MSKLDTTRGIVTASLATAGIAGVVAFAFVKISTEGSGASAAFMVAFFCGLATTFAGCIVIGIPAYAVLQRMGKRSFWAYLITGLILGPPIPISGYLLGITSSNPGFTTIFALAVIFGPPVTACTFWFIRRPDQDQPNERAPVI